MDRPNRFTCSLYVALCGQLLLAGCGQAPESASTTSDAGAVALESPSEPITESNVIATPAADPPADTAETDAAPTNDPAETTTPDTGANEKTTTPVLSAAPDLSASSVAIASADSWPVFRGTSESTGDAPPQLPDQPTLLWSRSFEKGGFESSAVIVGDVIYVGNLDGYLYALDAATSETRWTYFSELGFTATPAVRDGHVFIGDTDGLFVCLDAKDGKPIWHHQTDAEINSSANFYGDYVLVGSQDAKLLCLSRDDGNVVWQYTIGDMIQCGITVTEHYCFVAGCDAVLHVVDIETGKALHTVDIGDPTNVTPSVWGDMLYVGTQGGAVIGIDWRAGRTVWSRRNARRQLPFQSSPAIDPGGDGRSGRIVIGGRDKLVHCFEATSGDPLWEFTTKARVDSSPLIMGERAYFGSADGRIYGVDLASGKEVWSYEAGGKFSTSPSAASGRMVIGSSDGVLYCFGTSGDEAAAP